MRAKEFTINIPITITLNGDGEPEVSTGDAPAEHELQQNPVMVPPLQQHVELAKAEQGKESPVIDKLTASSDIGAEPEPTQDPALDRIKQLMGR
jgi:ribosome assembly protein YihI (activator of Der GTPase)